MDDSHFFNISHFSINYPRISECGQSRPREGSALKLSPLGLKGFSEETNTKVWLVLKLSLSEALFLWACVSGCICTYMCDNAYVHRGKQQTDTDLNKHSLMSSQMVLFTPITDRDAEGLRGGTVHKPPSTSE